MRWIRHPVGFAAVAAAAAVAIAMAIALPAGRAASSWPSGPLAVLGPERLGVAWWRDFRSGSAHVATPFAAADSAGVSAVLVPRDGGEAILAVQWRRRGDDVWHLHAQPHNLGCSRVFFDLGDDESWSGEIAEITISTLHDLPLQFEMLRIEAVGPLAELRRLWFLFAGTETYRQSSLNWLQGMRIGEADWSWWLASIWAAYAALQLALSRGRPDAATWRAISALALLLWVAGDLRFTANLISVAALDVDRFPSPLAPAAADAIVATADPIYRQLVERVRQDVPADAKLGFVSSDPSLLIRAKYVFYPRRVVHPPRRWAVDRPDYVAVFFDDRVRYHPAQQILAWGRFGRLAARPMARLGDRVGLFHITGRAAPAKRQGER